MTPSLSECGPRRACKPALALGVLLMAAGTAGCDPVGPQFQLSLTDSCGQTSMEAFPASCDGVLIAHFYRPDNNFRRRDSVCAPVAFAEARSLAALGAVDLDLAELPLGPTRVEFEVWTGDGLSADNCQASELRHDKILSGSTMVDIGVDTVAEIPLSCEAKIAQINRFAPGCSIEVEVADLDTGYPFRDDFVSEETDAQAAGAGAKDFARRPGLSYGAALKDSLTVHLGYPVADGSDYRFKGWALMEPSTAADGRWVWHTRLPDGNLEKFWGKIAAQQTVCLEVSDNDEADISQISCISAKRNDYLSQFEANYLPSQELDCLLREYPGSPREDGIVLGRAIRTDAESRSTSGAAGIRMLPYPVDDSGENPQQLRSAHALDDGALDDGALDDSAVGDQPSAEDDAAAVPSVSYVDKPNCAIETNREETTDSGYFLSSVPYPVSWQIEEDLPVEVEDAGTEAELSARWGMLLTPLGANESGSAFGTSDSDTQRYRVGGRLRNAINLVRVAVPSPQ